MAIVTKELRNSFAIGEGRDNLKGGDNLQEERGLGGKRVCRVGVNLTNKTNNKLSKLATACGMPKTTLAALLVERCLDDPLLISKLQQEFNKHAAYKVMPVKVNGETEYMFRG